MEKICANCQHLVPKYRGVGHCVAEGLPNAKFWVTGPEPIRLLTVLSFSCQGFTQKEDPRKDTL